MKLAILIICVGMLFGCAYSRSQTELSPEERSAGPLPANYKEMIIDYLKHNLYEPDSLSNLKIEVPLSIIDEKYHRKTGLQGGLQVWKIIIWVNAKTKQGGYTGPQPHFVYIRKGQIVAFL